MDPSVTSPAPRQLTDDREEIPADGAVNREPSTAEKEESEAGRPKHQRKFQVGEDRRTFSNHIERTGHDHNDPGSGEAREKSQEERDANCQLADHDHRREDCWKTRAGRGRPCVNGCMPAGSAEPTESLLRPVVEKDHRGRQSQHERARISRRMEKMIDGIVAHGVARYQSR